MTRLALGMVAVVAGLSGCASPARFVERTADSGVVAIPSNTDSWPGYNRREALALIQKHVGPSYEIVEEREVATGKKTYNDQQVNNEQTWNTSNPLLPANKQTVQNTTTTQDVTEYRIAYRKKTSFNTGGTGFGSGMPNGLTPAGGAMPSAGGPGTATQSITHPTTGAPLGVQPAGGVIPSVGPVGAAGPLAPAGGPPAGVYGSAGAFVGQMR